MEVITTYSDQEPALVEVHFSLKPRDWYKLEKKPYWKRVEEYLSEHYCNEMKNENIQKNRSNQKELSALEQKGGNQ